MAELKAYRRDLERAIAFFGRQDPVPPVRADVQAALDAVPAEQDIRAHVQTMRNDELRDIRRDLQAGLGLMRRESPMYAPATAYLDAVKAELARRGAWQA